MDWLTFISSIIGALAWPAGACVVALIFKGQIRDLLQKLSGLSFAGVEARFGESVEQIREDVKSVEDDPDYEDRPVEAKLVELVESHPHLAVLEGWKTLERAIISVSTKRLGMDRKLPVQSHIEALSRSDILPRAMISAITNIHEVRNKAAHEVEAGVSRGSAYLLLDMIADLTAYLEKAAGKN
jgi:hypothetical protein